MSMGAISQINHIINQGVILMLTCLILLWSVFIVIFLYMYQGRLDKIELICMRICRISLYIGAILEVYKLIND